MIYGGSSGYGFKEWVGHFYPEKTKPKDFLRFYATKLPSVEINHTFRRFPREMIVASWAEQTPRSFRFSFKMHQSVTHRVRLKAVRSPVEDFLKALRPLGARLGVVLFQLPPFFKRDLPRLENFLEELPPGSRYAIEFRHDSWNEPAVVERLRNAGVALAAAELDIETNTVVTTAPFSYLRFRKPPPYTDAEIEAIRGLLKKTAETVEDVYFYVKHDDAGLAPREVLRILG